MASRWIPNITAFQVDFPWQTWQILVICVVDCHEEKWWEWAKGIKPEGKEWILETEQGEALCKTAFDDFTRIIFLGEL